MSIYIVVRIDYITNFPSVYPQLDHVLSYIIVISHGKNENQVCLMILTSTSDFIEELSMDFRWFSVILWDFTYEFQ